MSQFGSVLVSINTEDEAWEVLRQLLDGEIDPKTLTLDFSGATWANFKAVYRGEAFHQSLTPSVMKGLIEYQNALYRCVALLLRNDARVNKLTDEEKDRFELTFQVRNGSSDLGAQAVTLLKQLGGQIIDKLAPEHVLFCALFISVAFFGTRVLDRVLKHAAEKHKTELDAEADVQLIGLVKELVQSDQKKWELFDRLSQAIPQLRQIDQQSSGAFDAILHASQGADELELQGRLLTSPTIRRLTQSSRRSAKDVIINGLFLVSNVDAKTSVGFVVKFEEVGGQGRTITANLTDVILGDRYGRVIKRATFSKEPIRARISARQIGDQYLDAKVLRASKPRAKP